MATAYVSDGFIATMRQEGRLSPSTLDAYEADLRQYEGYLEDKDIPLLDVLPVHLENLKVWMDEIKHYSAATIARKLAAVGTLYAHLKRSGQIKHNPTDGVRAPTVTKSAPAFMSLDDVQNLMKKVGEQRDITPVGHRNTALVRLLYATGMKISELVRLDLGDLDLNTGQIRCVGRNQRVRHLSLDAQTLVALGDYLEVGRPALLQTARPTEALFLNHRSRRITRQGVWLTLRVITHRAQLPFAVTPQILRHSFAAHRLREGALSHLELSARLGYRSPTALNAYTKVVTTRTLAAS